MIHEDRVIGIDVGKHVHEAWVWPDERRLRGRADTLAAFVDEIAALAPHAVALEATGGYERALADALHAAGLTVYILPPARVRAFARAGGQLAKTDRLDAALIARAFMACGARLHPHQPSPARNALSQLAAQPPAARGAVGPHQSARHPCRADGAAHGSRTACHHRPPDRPHRPGDRPAHCR